MNRLVASTRTRQGRLRLAAVLSTVVAIAIGVFAIAPSASAHHSEITASTDCSLQVSFTATSWNPGADNGVNNKVQVWYVVNDGPDTNATAVVATDHFGYDNGFDFSGTFAWPSAGASQITVYVQEKVWWGPNENIAAPASPRSTSVTKPGNCPGTPSASTTVACADGNGTATVTLTATGGSGPITFNVTNPLTQQVTQKVVQPGQSATVTITGLPDGQITIPITGGGKNLDQKVNVACDRPGTPSVDAKVACANGNGDVTITVANTGGEKDIVFVVTNPLNQQTTTKTVSPGQSATVTISGAPDGPLTIPVTADGTHVDQTVTVACDRPGVPSVTSSLQCTDGDGTVTITLANTGGDKPVTFVVTNPLNQQTTTKVLSPGQSTTVTISGLADGAVVIPVTADGKPMNQNLTVNCDRPGVPSVSSSAECVNTSGTITITLANTGGDLPVTFVVTDPRNQSTTTKTVNPHQSDTVKLTGFPDGTVTIPVVAGGTHLDQTLTVKCHFPGVPAVSVSHECQNFDGTATITLKNTGGTEPVHFVVRNPVTNTDIVVDVPSGGSHTVTIAGLTDGQHVISVTADGKHMDQTVSTQCDHPGTPSATATDDCTATGGLVTVTLSNTAPAGSAEPVTFVVTNPVTQAQTTVTVAAGASTTVELADIPDGSYEVAVTADGKALPSIAVTVDCQQPTVKSISISCTEGGAIVTLGNDGKTPVALTVSVDGVDQTSVTVPAGSTITVTVKLTEDQPTVITVKDEKTVVDEQTVTLDCQHPTTTTTEQPTTTVENTSTTPTASVLGIVQSRPNPAVAPQTTTPGTLPTTGSSAATLLLAGGLLLFAGTCLVAAARKHD